jgi:hypothetical protein
MNYDIIQLNDMIVPELLDIAEKLAVPEAKTKPHLQNLRCPGNHSLNGER